MPTILPGVVNWIVSTAQGAGISGCSQQLHSLAGQPEIEDLGTVLPRQKEIGGLESRQSLMTRENRPKILDFGLAGQAVQLLAAAGDAGACTVDTIQFTTPGKIVGTLAYMSPEQVRGESVTPASDIFFPWHRAASAAHQHMPSAGTLF